MLFEAAANAYSSGGAEVGQGDLLTALDNIAKVGEVAPPESDVVLVPAPRRDVPLSPSALVALGSVDLEKASIDELRNLLRAAADSG